MKKSVAVLITILLFSASGIHSIAQNNNDEVLITIAGERISKTEFLNIYNKNNVNSEVIDKKSLEDYLELYINFKLKVKEAEELGMDTVSAFIQELNGYRNQLAQPYLTDEAMNEKLIREAYDRMFFDIRASHILIRMAPDALPADTLAAYNRIVDIQNKIRQGKEFGNMAVEFSEDPSAKDRTGSPQRPNMKGNRGDLGYFTVFDMVYPFENAAYNTPVNEVSAPVRTDFGYHLIKVTDKKEALGKVQVAHILIIFPPDASHDDSLRLKDKASAAFAEILEGKNFTEVVKNYSDDKGTVDKGGILPWFGVNRMIPEFIVQISALKNLGDITEPFLTNYGWHIVKLIDKKPIGTYEEKVPEIKQKIARNDRAATSKKAFLSKLKKEYNYHSFPENLSDLYSIMNDSIYKGKWDPSPATGWNEPLFTINERTFTQYDLAIYMSKNQKGINSNQSLQGIVNTLFGKYEDEMILAYEDSRLEEKYPEFKMLMKEYRDGILLFELTDQKIWSKAVEDTVGLEGFYQKNKQNYLWEERTDATVYTLTDITYLKTVKKLVKKEIPKNDILDQVNQDSLMVLTIINDKFQHGDNEIIDAIDWEIGISGNVVSDNSASFAVIHALLPPQPKQLNEAKGIITADYQNFLEQEWIRQLRNKYPVEINYSVLSTIK
jgi:peptidyl-prolyl cis-trans isomerase SurA